MLTGKQKRYLRSLAHHLNPLVQIGKSGMTAGVLEQVDLELESHELIKISVMDTSPVSLDEVRDILLEETGAEWVQSIGKLVVLYRQSSDNPQIVVPRA